MKLIYLLVPAALISLNAHARITAQVSAACRVYDDPTKCEQLYSACAFNYPAMFEEKCGAKGALELGILNAFGTATNLSGQNYSTNTALANASCEQAKTQRAAQDKACMELVNDCRSKADAPNGIRGAVKRKGVSEFITCDTFIYNLENLAPSTPKDKFTYCAAIDNELSRIRALAAGEQSQCDNLSAIGKETTNADYTADDVTQFFLQQMNGSGSQDADAGQ